jgi:hypothetical protein
MLTAFELLYLFFYSEWAARPANIAAWEAARSENNEVSVYSLASENQKLA